MAEITIQLTTTDQVADSAMGVELMAIEVAERLEWAEAQGRNDDAAALDLQLRDLLDRLADIADTLPPAA